MERFENEAKFVSDSTNRWEKATSNALLLGLIGVISYVVSVQFQVGYLGYFNIPPQFAEATLIKAVNSSVYLIGTFLSVWVIFQAFADPHLLIAKVNGITSSQSAMPRFLLYPSLS